jgi:CubicO group peptidase (beta-lactamase class C family)
VLADMAEEGLVAFDDPVQRYLPEFAWQSYVGYASSQAARKLGVVGRITSRVLLEGRALCRPPGFRRLLRAAPP